jgi:hypothetical protein
MDGQTVTLVTLFGINMLLSIGSLILIIRRNKKDKDIENQEAPVKEVEDLNVDATKVLNDLMSIIGLECERRINIDLRYIYEKTTAGMDKSSLSVINVNEEQLDNIVTKASENIVDMLSDNFIKRISLVIDKDYIEDFIISNVFSILLKASLDINQSVNNKTNSKKSGIALLNNKERIKNNG